MQCPAAALKIQWNVPKPVIPSKNQACLDNLVSDKPNSKDNCLENSLQQENRLYSRLKHSLKNSTVGFGYIVMAAMSISNYLNDLKSNKTSTDEETASEISELEAISKKLLETERICRGIIYSSESLKIQSEPEKSFESFVNSALEASEKGSTMLISVYNKLRSIYKELKEKRKPGLEQLNEAMEDIQNGIKCCEKLKRIIKKGYFPAAQYMRKKSSKIKISDTKAVIESLAEIYTGNGVEINYFMDRGLISNIEREHNSTLNISYFDFFSILNNLIDNAIREHKKSAKRNKQILFSLEIANGAYFNGAQADKALKISVEDNACGIAEEKRADIFKKGVSFNNSTGMGLYHSSKDAERAGGQLKLEYTEQGFGSIFCLYLPLY